MTLFPTEGLSVPFQNFVSEVNEMIECCSELLSAESIQTSEGDRVSGLVKAFTKHGVMDEADAEEYARNTFTGIA